MFNQPLKKIGISMCLMLNIYSCASYEPFLTEIERKPKSVILLISDGTGLSHISSVFFHKNTVINYERFKNIGFIKTSSIKDDITDSAAAATAFATGEKTYNGAIGVDMDSTKLFSIVEILGKKQIETGIIATSSITHATPASFYAHVPSRGMQEEIAKDLTISNIDFFAGGGLKFFTKRKDGVNLLEKDYFGSFHIGREKLSDFEAIKNFNKVGYLLADNEMPKMQDGRGNFLPDALQLAVKFLSKDSTPFFLMAEGSQIDWGGHQNDGAFIISEMIDFDNAIGAALDFAEKDGNTLVIVTSDHETGGFTLSAETKTREDGTTYDNYESVAYSFSNGGHSASLIPVFAFGPGSEEFIGIYENTDIFHKIMKVTSWGKN